LAVGGGGGGGGGGAPAAVTVAAAARSAMTDGRAGEEGAGLPAAAAAALPAAAEGGGGARAKHVAGLLSALGIPVPVGAELEDEEEAAARAFQALGIAEGEGAQEQNAPNAGVCTEGTAPTPQEVAAVVAQCREEVAAGAAQCEAQRHPEGALPPCTGAAAGGARPDDAVLQRYVESGAQALRTFLANVKEAKQLLLAQKSMTSVNFARALHKRPLSNPRYASTCIGAMT
jgi:hypothetical protein